MTCATRLSYSLPQAAHFCGTHQTMVNTTTTNQTKINVAIVLLDMVVYQAGVVTGQWAPVGRRERVRPTHKPPFPIWPDAPGVCCIWNPRSHSYVKTNHYEHLKWPMFFGSSGNGKPFPSHSDWIQLCSHAVN